MQYCVTAFPLVISRSLSDYVRPPTGRLSAIFSTQIDPIRKLISRQSFQNKFSHRRFSRRLTFGTASNKITNNISVHHCTSIVESIRWYMRIATQMLARLLKLPHEFSTVQSAVEVNLHVARARARNSTRSRVYSYVREAVNNHHLGRRARARSGGEAG